MRLGMAWSSAKADGQAPICGAMESRLLVATMSRGLWLAGSSRDTVPTELKLGYCAEMWAKGLEMAGNGGQGSEVGPLMRRRGAEAEPPRRA